MQNLGHRKKRCQYTDRKETKRGKTDMNLEKSEIADVLGVTVDIIENLKQV